MPINAYVFAHIPDSKKEENAYAFPPPLPAKETLRN